MLAIGESVCSFRDFPLGIFAIKKRNTASFSLFLAGGITRIGCYYSPALADNGNLDLILYFPRVKLKTCYLIALNCRCEFI